MTKEINCSASRSFHRILRLCPRFLQFTRPPLLHPVVTPFIVFEKSVHRFAVRCFNSSFRDIFALSFLFFCFEFFLAVGQTRLRCFSHGPASFFIAPLLTNPRKQPVVVGAVVANRSRLRVTNVSDPIDVCLLFFRDRSSPPVVLKFDGNNVYIMIVNGVVKGCFFLATITMFL